METGLSLLFDALSSATRRQIISALGRRRRAGFVQLMRDAGFDPASETGSFTYHLFKLGEWGIVRRTPQGYVLTEFGDRAHELLASFSGSIRLSSTRGQGEEDMDIVKMGEEQLSQLAQAVFERTDEGTKKLRQETRTALGIKDESAQKGRWEKGHRQVVWGTLNPTPDMAGRPDAYASRALSMVARKNGKVVGSIFALEYPARRLPLWGWGIMFERADRPTQIEKLLSGDVAGAIGDIWVDPREDYEIVQEALVERILKMFKERGAKLVEIERRFPTQREVERFESNMNRLGLKARLKEQRIIMTATL